MVIDMEDKQKIIINAKKEVLDDIDKELNYTLKAFDKSMQEHKISREVQINLLVPFVRFHMLIKQFPLPTLPKAKETNKRFIPFTVRKSSPKVCHHENIEVCLDSYRPCYCKACGEDV